MNITSNRYYPEQYNLEFGISEQRKMMLLKVAYEYITEVFWPKQNGISVPDAINHIMTFGDNDNEKMFLVVKLGEYMGGQTMKHAIAKLGKSS